MNKFIHASPVALLLFTGALTACSSRTPRSSATANQEIRPSTTLTGARIPPTGLPPARADERPAYDSPEAAQAAAARAAARATPLTDAQALGYLSAVDKGMAQLGELGQRQASWQDVRSYGGMLLAHHGEAEARTRSIESSIGLERDARSNATARVEIEAASAVSRLQSAPAVRAASFDRLYLDTVVRAHRDILDTIDRRVLPGVKDEAVKSLANTVREQARVHLERAMALRAQLGVASSGARQGSDK